MFRALIIDDGFNGPAKLRLCVKPNWCHLADDSPCGIKAPWMSTAKRTMMRWIPLQLAHLWEAYDLSGAEWQAVPGPPRRLRDKSRTKWMQFPVQLMVHERSLTLRSSRWRERWQNSMVQNPGRLPDSQTRSHSVSSKIDLPSLLVQERVGPLALPLDPEGLFPKTDTLT